MARIPDEEIERLKVEVDLAELVVRSGVTLKKPGQGPGGPLPVPRGRHPVVGGDAGQEPLALPGAADRLARPIDWVMRTQGVSFRHAVEVLRVGGPRHRIGTASTGGHPVPVAKLPSPLDVSVEDQAVLSQVVDYYHATLVDSPEALAYLARRKIDHPEVIARFRLGYANRTLGYRLPGKRTKEGGAVRGRLERLGVLRASGHEHLTRFAGRPGHHPQRRGHRALRAQGRPAPPGRARPAHLYLPGPHPGVWNEEGLDRWRGDRLRIADRRAHVLLLPASSTSPPPTAPPGSPPITPRPSSATG